MKDLFGHLYIRFLVVLIFIDRFLKIPLLIIVIPGVIFFTHKAAYHIGQNNTDLQKVNVYFQDNDSVLSFIADSDDLEDKIKSLDSYNRTALSSSIDYEYANSPVVKITTQDIMKNDKSFFLAKNNWQWSNEKIIWSKQKNSP